MKCAPPILRTLLTVAVVSVAIIGSAPGAAPDQPLKAYLWENENCSLTPLTGMGRLLSEAGFTVEAFPGDQKPSQWDADLIVFGSFTNLDKSYKEYLKKNKDNLRKYVEQGGVLLQMAQREESQISQLFLPNGVRASRGDAILGDIRISSPGHPLLSDLGDGSGKIDLPLHLGLAPSWHTFMEQQGCAVLLGAGEGVDNPVLLEAAAGKGRFLMTSLFFDRLYDAKGTLKAPPAYEKLAEKFVHNLASYVGQVKAGQAPSIAVTPKPVPLPFVAGAWTIAVLPDTQYYSEKNPEVFEAQTRWIAENAKKYNLKYVLHLGDITNKNLKPQWKSARKAMAALDGVVPYALIGGNHDYGPKGNSATRESFFNEYFPLSFYEKWPSFGGAMEPGKMDNTYHLFDAGGEKWIVLALEMAPRDEVVAWADRILTEHPEHRGILVTHAYLYANNKRYDFAKYGRKQGATPHHYGLSKSPGSGNDGEELWQKLVSKHPNMLLTLNGHVLRDGVGRLSSQGVHGNTVHQMLVNYQRMQPTRGNGFLRLYEFLPDGKTIQVRSYSPFWDRYKTDVQNQFTLEIEPIPAASSTP